MRNYELLTVFPGTLTETELEPELEKVKKAIKDSGAEDIEVKNLGKTRMSYPMDGIEYGYYYVHQYQLNPENASELREELDKINSLLRSIMDKYDPEKRENEVDSVESLQGRDEILKMIKEKHKDNKDEKEEQEKKKSDKKEKETDTQKEEQKAEGDTESEKKTKEEQKEESEPEKKKKDGESENEDEDDVSLDEIDEKLDEILEDDDLTDV